MKTMRFCSLYFFALATFASAQDALVCPWTHIPPVIDGNGEDEAWKSIGEVGPFLSPWEKDPEKHKPLSNTVAKVCWDRENFYFFAKMEDSDLFARETDHDGNLWEGDVFEIFFKPSENFSGYYEFEFNPNNAQLDVYFPQRRAGGFHRFKDDFAFDLKTAVQVDGSLNKWTDRDKGWSIEGRIRWRDFVRAGGRPRVGDEWKFALCRYDYSVDFDGANLSTTAPLQRADFHQHEDFSFLRFEGPKGNHPTKPFGISSLPPIRKLKLKGRPGKPPPYRVERAYPNLKLPFPVTMDVLPGTDVMLAVIQDWSYAPTRIIRFKDDPEVGAYEVIHSYDGVAYDFAFHPQFRKNGFFYVGWNNGKLTRITRYTFDLEKMNFDKDSALDLISWEHNGHNGGAIDFGPDGYLYVTTGDGTSDSDTLLNGQRTDVLFAKVLRVDVDKQEAGKPYSIPKDNPFVGRKDFAPETWAYGFRNPWRIDVDDKTGHVWVGNNGQDLWEQIYFVRKGANYGWSVYEGSRPFYPNRKLGPTPVSKPIFEHSHAVSRSLTGGIVYHGKKLSKLKGYYLYGDYSTGKIWAAKHDGDKVLDHLELTDTSLSITDFKLNSRGELLIADHARTYEGGGFYHLVPTGKEVKQGDFPKTLSKTGLFTNLKSHELASGVIPYSVNAEQWSDGFVQSRALALPAFPDESGSFKTLPIGFRRTRTWEMPEGTVLIKTVSLPVAEGDSSSFRPVETQVLTLQEEDWAAYVYKWNKEQTDATLVDAGGEDVSFSIETSSGKRDFSWRHAGRAECMFCHSRAAGFALGMNTLQLNRDHDYDGIIDNQFRVFDHLRLFTDDWIGETRKKIRSELLEKERPERRKLPDVIQAVNDQVKELFGGGRAYSHPRSDRLAHDPETHGYPHQADPFDENASLDLRARSYLHANCANCHVGAGGGNAAIDLAHDAKPEKREIFDVKPKHLDFGIKDARLVSAGKPDKSVLLHRMTLLGPGQMPIIGRKTIDRKGVDLIRRWIAEMKPQQK